MSREKIIWGTGLLPVAVLFLLAVTPCSVLAQEPAGSIQQLPSRLQMGDTVRITDSRGKRTEGTFDGITGSSLRMKVDGEVREFDGPSLRQVDRKYRDPLSNGVWMGALIGGAGGAVVGIAGIAPEGCESSQCRITSTLLWGAIGGGIGAAAGALGDSLSHSYVRVFSATETTGYRWGISPILSRDTRGGKVTFRF